MLKTFYASLNDLVANGPIGSFFITGVTTIRLDSMTSGFSVAENLATNPEFSTLFGFTETELRNLIGQVINLKQYGKSLDEVVSDMKEWYNGYCFNPDTQETVFNASQGEAVKDIPNLKCLALVYKGLRLATAGLTDET